MFAGDAVEDAVDQPRFGAVEKGVRHIDILGDGDTGRDVGPPGDFMDPGLQDQPQDEIEASDLPIRRQGGGDQPVEIGAPGDDTANHIAEQFGIRFHHLPVGQLGPRFGIGELGNHRIRGAAGQFDLVKGLHRGQPGGRTPGRGREGGGVRSL